MQLTIIHGLKMMLLLGCQLKQQLVQKLFTQLKKLALQLSTLQMTGQLRIITQLRTAIHQC